MKWTITSRRNERVKRAARLRDRGGREEAGRLLIEGYRETRRALDNGVRPLELFFCPALFQGSNEPALIEQCAAAGADLLECADSVFRKLSYRDRPDGLLMIAPRPDRALSNLSPPPRPFLLVAERLEKSGNLGALLRSADASGVNGVIVCDRGADVDNPNVVRASIGALFALPVVEASSNEALRWLRERSIRIAAATPRAELLYTDADLTGGLALVVGSEPFGLTDIWMEAADLRLRIPMLGQCDSLNVSAAATILLFEAVRQRTRRPGETGGRTRRDRE